VVAPVNITFFYLTDDPSSISISANFCYQLLLSTSAINFRYLDYNCTNVAKVATVQKFFKFLGFTTLKKCFSEDHPSILMVYIMTSVALALTFQTLVYFRTEDQKG
jgi:hypothetical protein